MTIYKFTNTVDGEDDPVFVEAPSEALARKRFTEQIGPMPSGMLKVVEVDEIPDGYDAL